MQRHHEHGRDEEVGDEQTHLAEYTDNTRMGRVLISIRYEAVPGCFYSPKTGAGSGFLPVPSMLNEDVHGAIIRVWVDPNRQCSQCGISPEMGGR